MKGIPCRLTVTVTANEGKTLELCLTLKTLTATCSRLALLKKEGFSLSGDKIRLVLSVRE